MRHRHARETDHRLLEDAIVVPIDAERERRSLIDRRVLRQVAENLNTNAMKYAADGGELVLEVRSVKPGYWQLRVLDRGTGVSDEKRKDLFKPFMRLSGREDGLSSGLGLSLARQIIVNAGGDLWYEDRDGGGAVFVIELPAIMGVIESVRTA